MSDAPGPLVPAGVDLRGLPFMPLDVVRLLDSDIFALSTGDEFKAAVALWGRSWLQVPAASLPDDDRILAHLSGAESRWRRVKARALHGWILCSDGRWYHPVVAEKAREAWSRRVAQRAKANKRWQSEGNAGAHAKAEAAADAAGHAAVDATAMQGTGTGTGTGTKAALPGEIGESTKAGAWAADLRRRGVAVTSQHPTLLAWITEGFELPAVIEALEIARQRKPEPEKIPPGYLDPILRNPPKAATESWWRSEAATIAKGRELGMEPRRGEEMDSYRDRIRQAKAGAQA